jgi:hypothetical protein
MGLATLASALVVISLYWQAFDVEFAMSLLRFRANFHNHIRRYAYFVRRAAGDRFSRRQVAPNCLRSIWVMDCDPRKGVRGGRSVRFAP